MTVATDPRMTLKDYLTYDDGTETRYELEDGVLIEMGAKNPLNPQIASFLLSVFFQLGVPIYRLVIGHQIGVSSTRATARQPDLMVHFLRRRTLQLCTMESCSSSVLHRRC